MNNFVQRTLTGVLFAIVMLGSIYFSKYSFIVIFIIINMVALLEFYSRTEENSLRLIHGIGLVAGSVLLLFITFWQLGLIPASYLLLFVALIFTILAFALFESNEKAFTILGKIFTGLLWISLPIGLLLWFAISESNYTWQLVAIPLVLTWINDVFAYLGGMLFGKHKLAPKLSPKKTIEGSITGIVFTAGAAFAISIYVGTQSAFVWLILGVNIAVSAIFGDLVESKWKRGLGIKDSGKLLPGHGGLLDRFDAFLFVIPFYVIFIKLFVS